MWMTRDKGAGVQDDYIHIWEGMPVQKKLDGMICYVIRPGVDGNLPLLTIGVVEYKELFGGKLPRKGTCQKVVKLEIELGE